jgi:hypothetical protein
MTPPTGFIAWIRTRRPAAEWRAAGNDMGRIVMSPLRAAALGLALLTTMIAAPTAGAQTAAETSARVPELAAFHEVIFPMWHRAWAEKDTALLRELWPGIQEHVAAVRAAELPGILRDRKPEWERGLERLALAEARYGRALAGGTIEDKLGAAEEMHATYEGLVRAMRPPKPELAHFHEVLYRIYHYDTPGKDRAALVAALPALAAEMDTLSQAAPPPRLADARRESFAKKRHELAGRVEAVVAAAATDDWKRTAAAVEAMHTAYREVEQVFEE